MKKFVSGMLLGTAVTCATLAGLVVVAKKQIIDPIEEKESMIANNRKKAMRKRIAR